MRKPCEIKAGYIVQDLILVVTFTGICARNKISIFLCYTHPATKMGIFENTNVNYTKLFLVIAFLIVLSEVSTAQRKQIDCRKFVFAPPCRGIAAKRDTHSHSSDVRLIPSEDSDYIIEGQKPASNENYAAINGLLGFLKRAMSKNPEYDSTTNYLS